MVLPGGPAFLVACVHECCLPLRCVNSAKVRIMPTPCVYIYIYIYIYIFMYILFVCLYVSQAFAFTYFARHLPLLTFPFQAFASPTTYLILLLNFPTHPHLQVVRQLQTY